MSMNQNLSVICVLASFLLPSLGAAACVDFNNGRLCVDVVYVWAAQYRLVSNVPNLYNTSTYPALRCEVTLPDGIKREQAWCDMTFSYNGWWSEIKILMGFDKQVLYRGFAYRFADSLATLWAPYIPSEQYNTLDSTRGSSSTTIISTNPSTTYDRPTNPYANTTYYGWVGTVGSLNTLSIPIAWRSDWFTSAQYSTVKRVYDAWSLLIRNISNTYPRARNNVQRQTQQQRIYLNMIDILGNVSGKSYTQYSVFVGEVSRLVLSARNL